MKQHTHQFKCVTCKASSLKDYVECPQTFPNPEVKREHMDKYHSHCSREKEPEPKLSIKEGRELVKKIQAQEESLGWEESWQEFIDDNVVSATAGFDETSSKFIREQILKTREEVIEEIYNAGVVEDYYDPRKTMAYLEALHKKLKGDGK